MLYIKSVRFLSPLLFAFAASATTWCVNPTGANGCKTTISAAVAVAAAGDTVSVGGHVQGKHHHRDDLVADWRRFCHDDH